MKKVCTLILSWDEAERMSHSRNIQIHLGTVVQGDSWKEVRTEGNMAVYCVLADEFEKAPG